FRLLQLIEQLRADGQQIGSRKADDLIHVAETCSHDLRLVSICLVVVVNTRYRGHSRVLVGENFFAASFFLVPVVDAAHERRDESDASFGARRSLSEAKQQSEIAVNSFLLQFTGRLN